MIEGITYAFKSNHSEGTQYNANQTRRGLFTGPVHGAVSVRLRRRTGTGRRHGAAASPRRFRETKAAGGRIPVGGFTGGFMRRKAEFRFMAVRLTPFCASKEGGPRHSPSSPWKR